jgi:ABC-type phosphate transport system substrate-binding protein
VVIAGSIGTAGADNGAPKPGQDNKPDIIITGGSDTTYALESDLALAYNQSPGCKTENGSTNPNVGFCINPGGTPNVPGVQNAPAANAGTNWDHDVIVNLYPTGSTAGVNGLLGLNGYSGVIDMARSSRGPNASGESALNFWGFAKDGVPVITLGTQPTIDLTPLKVAQIWNCDINTWDQITGNPADAGRPIRRYGMNPSSGTYATFRSFLQAQIAGADPNKPGCGEKLQDGTYPFENDVKPIIKDVAARGWNLNDVIWWASYAEMKTYPYKAQGASFAKLNGVTISNTTVANGTYPFNRIVYRVTRKADANAVGSSSDLTGATGGKGGAVRRATEWLCKEQAWYNAGTIPSNPTNAQVDDFTGQTYFTIITNILSQNGYQRIPVAERTNGACKLVPGP